MRVRRTALFGAAAVVLAFVLAPGIAGAQGSDADKATARALGLEGQEALDRKDYKTAVDRFGRAEDLFHAPTLLLGLARAQVGMGHLVAAQETYNRIVREGAAPGGPPAFVQAVEDAKAESKALAGRIPWVVVTVQGPASPRVTLDKAPYPNAALGVRRAIDPGNHLIRVEADGFTPVEKAVTVREGAAETVSITLEPSRGAAAMPAAVPPPPAAPTTTSPPPSSGPPDKGPQASSGASTLRTLSYVSFGLGAAGLIAGGVTGGLALAKHGALAEECPDDVCPAGKSDEVEEYRTMGGISTICFAVGGVGIAGGITLFAIASARDKKASGMVVHPYIGLGHAGATGTF